MGGLVGLVPCPPISGSTLLLITTAPCWSHVGEFSPTERRGILSNSARLPRNLNLGKEKNREDGKF